MDKLRVTLVQYDIQWETPLKNLEKLNAKLQDLKGQSDLAVLPEMFSTGFSMNPEEFAEEMTGSTMNRLKYLSSAYDIALVGSFMVKEGDQFFNRGFFVEPTGQISIYDKRHLFRMGDEPKHYTAGNQKKIVQYKGWNINLLVCYDLRFPVWARNRNNEYDLLIYVANWPAARAKVWDILLSARAIENMCYVCGVNRLGVDGLGIKYSGNSRLINPRGDDVLALAEKETEETIEISLIELQNLRQKFPVWKDADIFDVQM
ncbi:MAG: amidohydrolase [Bacteroidales bacterium]|nr:amidohydrolase [Bacteroidales bacterium]